MSESQNEPLSLEKDGSWTTLLVDSQLLSAFMKCPRYFDLRFNRHLVPIGAVGGSLGKGILAHHGLATYYNSIKDKNSFSISLHLAMDAMRQKAPETGLEADDCLLVYRTVEENLNFRKNDIFNVLGTEVVFRKVIYEVFPLRIVVTGRIDLITQDFKTDKIIPYDHKSEAQSWFYSSTSNQFKIYAIACETDTLIVNRIGFQSSKKPEDKFKRESLHFSKEILDEFKSIVVPYYAQQLLIAWQDKYFAPNFASCISGSFGCMFSDKSSGVCTEGESMREQIIQIKFRQEEWNPEFEV